MNQALEQLASELSLMSPGNEAVRLAFGYACATRIRHLLEEAEVVECLKVLGAYYVAASTTTCCGGRNWRPTDWQTITRAQRRLMAAATLASLRAMPSPFHRSPWT